MADSRRVLVIGAHPDDAEIKAGGLAAHHVAAGNAVTFVSLTDGSAGHHELGRDALARRRAAEAEAAATVLGIENRVLDIPDGELRPTLESRQRVIRLLRTVRPDLVLTHRPWDYHPDHRSAARLVQDATYLVRVPNVCPDVAPLDREPVVGYLADRIASPRPFAPDVIVAIDDVLERKLDALHEHASQVYEWLPAMEDAQRSVPEPDEERRAWLADVWGRRFRAVADRHRDALVARYGDAGRSVSHAEAFEHCPYGRSLPDDPTPLFP